MMIVYVRQKCNDEEKRAMIQGFIKEIQIYPKEEQEKTITNQKVIVQKTNLSC
ncbi:MAG: hypothetical protein NC242_09720 [Roseburia sp.]|nr:hypothetical protein [Roseburia sp.]MCM1430255.1 hypothetical protein [Muribaculaceae bacterium]